MQQFPPYFAGYENPVQPLDGNQGQSQQPLNLNSSNIAVYPNPVAMQPLSALSEQQRKDAQDSDLNSQGKPKRKQVKNACVNCQKACKKCDEGRPCQRCIKYGLTETCINSVRKERKKGIKRGPYKKRNKTGNESITSSGASTPNITTMNNPAIYSNGNVRANPISMPYQPFSVAGHYDPFQAVAYASSGQILSQAYMVPGGMQAMPSGNPPVLTFQAAMNMITPQQQHQQSQQQSQGEENDQKQNGGVSTPSTSGAVATTSTAAADDDDDEGSKLNILSQLCSQVLSNNDPPPKQETDSIKTESHQNTPPPSNPHSRQTSNEINNNNNNNNNNAFTSSTTPTTTEATAAAAVAAVAHSYLNGHLAPRNDYSAPGSTSNSPTVKNETWSLPSNQ